MNDETEALRRARFDECNEEATNGMELEQRHVQVWNSQQMRGDFLSLRYHYFEGAGYDGNNRFYFEGQIYDGGVFEGQDRTGHHVTGHLGRAIFLQAIGAQIE